MEKKIIRLKEVDSTNTFLKNLDTYDEDALTIAIADYQTAGRGQGVHTCFCRVIEGVDVIDDIRPGDLILSIRIVEE